MTRRKQAVPGERNDLFVAHRTVIAILAAGMALIVGWAYASDRWLGEPAARWSVAGIALASLGAIAGIMLYQAAARTRARSWTDIQPHIIASVMAYSPFALAVLDRHGKIVDLNEGTSQLLGYGQDSLVGRKFLSLVEHGSRQFALSSMEQALQGAMEQGPLKVVHQSGIPLDLHIVSTPIHDKGQVVGILMVSHDSSDRKRDMERIRYMAYYDDMTGLPNRRMFMAHLSEALSSQRPDGTILALIYVDLDRFKLVNDSFGREFGDMLLLQVAERLTRGLSEHDLAGRMEGDEFYVLLNYLASEQEAIEQANSILQMLEEPFELQGIPFNITASIGVAVSSHASSDDPGQLVKQADMALGQVKENGKNGAILYNPGWESYSLERLRMQHELNRALRRQEFVLVYQPQYHLATGQIVGIEALVRWHHPERGLVPPGQFIPIAEESGIIVPIGDWVMQEACRQNKIWQEQGLLAVPISINLSVRQFMQQNLASRVASILQDTGLAAKYLDLEITESMTMDINRATECLEELAQLGVGISVDDFGTGYSSFHYLKQLPINRLKIDRSFVRDIMQDPSDAAIVAAIIAMAHTLHLEVIAEGVETEEQMHFLKQHRCDEMQGYLWSPPVTSMRMEQLLAQATFSVRK